MRKTYFSFILFFAINQLIAQSVNNSKDEVVYTPSGPALKSQVHFVDSRHHLNMKDGNIQIVENKTGSVSQEFNSTIIDGNKNIISNSKSKTSKSVIPDDNGWATYAYWENPSSTPISYFSTNWIVSTPPVTDTTQTIFLFNGLCPPAWDWILQPVLQWGVSAAGGGNYWTISNWYVSSGSTYFCDSLIRVSPGTNLQGIMILTTDSSGVYNYNSSFLVDSLGTSLPGNNLQVTNIGNILTTAFQTLEVYGVTQCTDYPADTVVKMTDILINTGSINPSITWIPQDPMIEYGQNTSIVSNSSTSGEVDIRYHTPCIIPTGIKSNLATSDDIYIYPNPAFDKFTIEAPLKSIIEISDIQGQIIKILKTNDYNNIIDVSDFKCGMYFAKVKTGNAIVLKKLVKE
jgi:hypothetical protein